MNKKLKKALYMLGFALPIVAIPIITVACGTQTSQNAPKEADKNQNEQTPKQETPIQDENKKVTVSSSLSSSKIYDESLINSNVIELFKLFELKFYLENIKEIIEEILKKIKNDMNTLEKLDMLSANQVNKLGPMLKNLESLENSISETKIKSINEITQKIKTAVELAKTWVELEKIALVRAKEAEAAEIAATNEANELAKEALEPEKPIEAIKDAASNSDEEIKEETEEEIINEETEIEKKATKAVEAKAKAEVEATNAELNVETQAIKLIDQSLNKIIENTTNLYKKLFLNESSFDMTNFSELKYNDFLSKFSELKLINFFNIENLKKHLQNLAVDNKLNEIALKDIFNSNIYKLIDYFKKDQTNKEIKSDLIKTQNEANDNKLIYNAIKENDPTAFEKIKDDLNNDLTQPKNIKSLLEKLTFSDLFDVDKLQEKLN